MKPMALSSLLFLFMAAAAGSQSTLPDGRQDYEVARDAVSRGDFLPLDEILDIVATSHPGQLVELELETEDSIWVYEVEIVTPEGRLIEIDLNAATGQILGVEDNDD